jgi:hypothetical protein
MKGAEYLTDAVLRTLWDEMAVAFAQAFARSGTGLQSFLNTLNPAWNLVGRVHFNLAENRRDAAQPFAFMATYTTRLSAQARAQHVPLGQALREYAGANRDKLLSLLLPVQRAAEHCGWLRAMVDAGEIFHPLRWGPPRHAAFSIACRSWRAPVSSSACPPPGGPIARPGPGSLPPLAVASLRLSGLTACLISR